MAITAAQPIGIFDSGIGGLTIAHAVHTLLPQENLIYFGDTAHLPWGDKSAAAIQAYTIRICDMLLRQSCKLILIACHTASAVAYELLKEYVGTRAIIIDVIDPTVDYIKANYANCNLGLIGTRQTIHSNVYRKKIDALEQNIALQALATPLLAPIIEEGFADNKIAEQIISDYLSQPELAKIEALILGCTHYPLIKNQIAQFYQNNVDLLDSATIVAHALPALLKSHDLLNTGVQQKNHFYVSDYSETFAAAAKIFFQENIHLEHYPLWDT